ncbi:hypothetical protein G9A89_006786 [Geosiphon pyriformis]|nr:hypothetical protein G9A89_006786 [Geosiphon pyriformis]
MQPTTNNQSSFNPLSIIAPGNGSIKGPTGDPDDGSGTGQCSIIETRKKFGQSEKKLFKKNESDNKVLVTDQQTLDMLALHAHFSQKSVLHQGNIHNFGSRWSWDDNDKRPDVAIGFGSFEVNYYSWPILRKNSPSVPYSDVEGAKVEATLNTIWKTLSPIFLNEINAFELQNKFTSRRPHYTFTGYSQGGVLAVYAALEYALAYNTRPKVITFGQPQIGNKAFAEYANLMLNVYRVTYRADFVPKYPVSVIDDKRKVIDEYLPLATEYWIPEEKDCNCGPSLDENRSISFPLVFKCEKVGSILPSSLCNNQFNHDLLKENSSEHQGPYFGYVMRQDKYWAKQSGLKSCFKRKKDISRKSINLAFKKNFFQHLQANQKEKFSSDTQYNKTLLEFIKRLQEPLQREYNHKRVKRNLAESKDKQILVESPEKLNLLATHAKEAYEATYLKGNADRLIRLTFASLPETLFSFTTSASNEKYLIIKFKGTSSVYSNRKVNTGVAVAYSSGIPNVYVENLYYRKWIEARDVFWGKMRYLLEDPGFSNVKDLFTFTAFGRGGVFAIFAALEFAKSFELTTKPKVVTFGLPRMGNKNFVEFVDSQLDVYRVTHGDDWVPAWPKWGLYDNKISVEYYQLSREYWIPYDKDCSCKQLTKSQQVFPIVYECFRIGSFEENQNCNAGSNGRRGENRNVRNIEDHYGPYFGYKVERSVRGN